MSTALVDFSALFHRIWHINKDEAAHRCESFLRELQYDRVIVCIDSPPYKRKEICPEYKANRDVPDPELVGQLRAAIERASANGFEIAYADGWEADDVIASLCQTMNIETVFGTDKDLLQVCDLWEPFTNNLKTPESILGVSREQVVDYLAMIGDSSDNIRGVKGVGPKTAQALLCGVSDRGVDGFGSLKKIYDAVFSTPEKFKPSTLSAFLDAAGWIDQSVKLITLRNDLDVVIDKPNHTSNVIDIDSEPAEHVEVEKHVEECSPKQEAKYMVRTETVDYRHSLEPVGIDQAWKAAGFLFRSGLYQKYKGPEQVMAVVMRGRALGLDATTALDQVNMIQGTPTLSAQAMVAIVKASPICKYFSCIEMSDSSCTWVTHRVGEPCETRRTFTREEADRGEFSTQPEYVWENRKKVRTGKIVTKDAWKKQPNVMLQWRCAAALARQVYPDLLNGMYATEEMQ